MHGIAAGQHIRQNGVTRLVIGDQRLVLLGDDAGLLFGADLHAGDGLLQLGHADGLGVFAGGKDRRLV